jgi:hypothetical protein
MFPNSHDGSTLVGTPVKFSNVAEPEKLPDMYEKGEHTSEVLREFRAKKSAKL